MEIFCSPEQWVLIARDSRRLDEEAAKLTVNSLGFTVLGGENFDSQICHHDDDFREMVLKLSGEVAEWLRRQDDTQVSEAEFAQCSEEKSIRENWIDALTRLADTLHPEDFHDDGQAFVQVHGLRNSLYLLRYRLQLHVA